jgi:hypothetical protein
MVAIKPKGMLKDFSYTTTIELKGFINYIIVVGLFFYR